MRHLSHENLRDLYERLVSEPVAFLKTDRGRSPAWIMKRKVGFVFCTGCGLYAVGDAASGHVHVHFCKAVGKQIELRVEHAFVRIDIPNGPTERPF